VTKGFSFFFLFSKKQLDASQSKSEQTLLYTFSCTLKAFFFAVLLLHTVLSLFFTKANPLISSATTKKTIN
jgi:hypothetical protein